MKRTSLDHMTCSIARTMDVIGEWWTPLILRDLFLGVTRFEDLRRDLGIATNVLSDRLETLQAGGVVERHPYQDSPIRHEYVLTEKGRDLYPVILTVMAWGDRWMADGEGPPALVHHRSCAHNVSARVVCDHCGESLTQASTVALAGPGGKTGPGTAVIGPLLAARG
jgi:DNA-binding HxlR family transcriptional regulator